MAPALSITSLFTNTFFSFPSWMYSTPTARLPDKCVGVPGKPTCGTTNCESIFGDETSGIVQTFEKYFGDMCLGEDVQIGPAPRPLDVSLRRALPNAVVHVLL